MILSSADDFECLIIGHDVVANGFFAHGLFTVGANTRLGHVASLRIEEPSPHFRFTWPRDFDFGP